MSFSGQIREEIARITDSARHCMLAEAAALTVTAGAKNGSPASGKLRELLRRITGKETAGISNEAMQAMHLKSASDETVSALLLKNTCCRRAYLRGMYLAVGSMSDPQRGYHMEFVCTGETQAAQLREILQDFEIHAGETIRKGKHVVYLKESESIAEILNIIGAHRALMEIENLRIVKDLRSTANRRVNCDSANIQKALSAAKRQIEDIRYLKEHGGFENLTKQLREIAEVRLENPEATLIEISEMLDPPVGKSGVNHRLRKLSELADELRSRSNQG